MQSTPIPPLQLQAVSLFFNRLYNQYPHLFVDDKAEFYRVVQDKLALASQNLTFENMLDAQRLIFKRLEHVNQPDWYKIFHSVYVQTLRTSAFGRQLFVALLAECQVVIGLECFDHVIAPGCGKFYEAEDVCAALSVQHLDALDIDYQDLELSRAIHPTLVQAKWRYQDLTQPICKQYDLALFMHPQVCDYDKLWASPTYKRYGDEFRVPVPELHRSATHKYMPAAWVAILDNTFAALKDGGHAVFMFYEHRELVMTQSYLANKPSLQACMSDVNTLIVDPAFSHEMLSCMAGAQQPSAEFVAMGAYRAVLVVKKQAEPTQ